MVVGCASRSGDRRRRTAVLPIGTVTWRHLPEVMALPLPVPATSQSPETDPSRLAPHRIKRCTYRRLISLDRARERIYEVECLYPDRKVPIPLGDLDSALPICNACAAAHIFRPDED